MSVRTALLFVCVTAGCSAPVDQIAPEAEAEGASAIAPSHWIDGETNTDYLLNHDRKVVFESFRPGHTAEGLGFARQAINATGTMLGQQSAIQVVECSTPLGAGRLSAGCSVDPEYILVGGGAEDTWMYTANSPGGLLTESRPRDANDLGDRSTWLASSKDHYYPASRSLHVWAVGLRMRDYPRDRWFAKVDLRYFMHYDTATSSPSLAPEARCQAQNGMILGGGARANGPNQLLTASMYEAPEHWVARAKPHIYPEYAAVTAYCIYLNNLAFPGFKRVVSTASHTTDARWDAVEAPLKDGLVPTCYGGTTTYSGAGRMLFRLGPQDHTITKAVAGSKDHGYYDGGTTTAQLLMLDYAY